VILYIYILQNWWDKCQNNSVFFCEKYKIVGNKLKDYYDLKKSSRAYEQ
jgi:hypothetical protein